MLIRCLSDLHLEFSNWEFEIPEMPYDSETTLILAGDIGVGQKHLMWIAESCRQFQDVIYIHGNHEYYYNEYYDTLSFWESASAGISNLHFLNNSEVIIDSTIFFGGTMWTDFNNRDYYEMFQAQQSMNDYDMIKILHDSGLTRKLIPAHTAAFHDKFKLDLLQFLYEYKDSDMAKVVVSHHLPSRLCVHPQFKNAHLNSAYHANMDDIMLDNKIDLWLHGHTHKNMDHIVHGVRVVSNPRGYHGYETPLDTGFQPRLILEV